jgi:hypothetical protein
MRHFRPFAVLVVLMLLPVSTRGGASVYPLGVTVYVPEKCWNGYTILSSDEGRLVDMNGNLAHLWKGPLHHPNKVLPGGHLLTSTASWKHGFQDAIEIQLRDFDDNVLWRFDRWQEGTANEGEGKIWLSRQHHDLQVKGNPVGYYIPNHDTLNTTEGSVLALGHYNTQNARINTRVRLLDDAVYEIDIATKQLVWVWKAADHLDEMGFDEAALEAMRRYDREPKKEGEGFDWFHQNCASYVGPNRWFDQGDERFHPDNIILGSRAAGLLVIVDRQSGRVVWRVGPYYRDGDDKKLGWLIGPHHAHLIPRGLPGEGNILVFDNGGQSGYGPPSDVAPDGISVMRRAYSRVLEFDPVTKDIVWDYAPSQPKAPKQGVPRRRSGHDLFSAFISSAQRLANGNTLITEGNAGRVIEVTRDCEVVWEYVSPYLWDSSKPAIRNAVYRAYRVPYGWVPQLPRPKESAVDPGPNYMRVIPAKDGSRPDFGVGRTPIWEEVERAAGR